MVTLNAILSNGSAHALDPGEHSAEELLNEIVNRENEYEWVETAEGGVIRVEAIDELWLNEDA